MLFTVQVGRYHTLSASCVAGLEMECTLFGDECGRKGVFLFCMKVGLQSSNLLFICYCLLQCCMLFSM